MNSNQNVPLENRASGAAAGFLIACLLFIGLDLVVRLSVKAPAIDSDRAGAMAKSLAEIRAVEEKSLSTPGWIDPSRGIVRLPIEDAMQLIEKEGAEGARADLLRREEKASAPAPKPANLFE